MPVEKIKVNSLQQLKNVESLTDKMKKLTKNDALMIWYHAKWCGHCDSMKEEWKEMGKKVRNPKGTLYIIEVEETPFNHVKSAHSLHPLAQIGQSISAYPVVLSVKPVSNRKMKIEKYDDWADRPGNTTGNEFRKSQSFIKFANFTLS